MPKKYKPPRLYLNRKEGTWLIRDRSYTERTGCDEHERERAEKRLAKYITEKYAPKMHDRRSAKITVAQVLLAYSKERAVHLRSRKTAGYVISILGSWWGRKTLAEADNANSKAYTTWRTNTLIPGKRKKYVRPGTVRRELAVLQSAIKHWHKEYGPLDAIPVLTMPKASAPRSRWLTREEAAALLAGALGWVKTKAGWKRKPAQINRHLARFIIMGLYTGSRCGVLLAVQWVKNDNGGHIDLPGLVMHRKTEDEEETKKRKPPVKIGRRLAAHLRRWSRMDAELRIAALGHPDLPAPLFQHVVAWNGLPIGSIRTAWLKAVAAAKLDTAVTPHTLRHTRATWLMQAGVDKWEASGALGMSFKTLEEVYGHHHQDFQSKAAEV